MSVTTGGTPTHLRVVRAEEPISDVIRSCGGGTLGADPPSEAVLAFLNRLKAALAAEDDPARRVLLECAAADVLAPTQGKADARRLAASVRPKTYDKPERGGGSRPNLRDTVPWPDPVGGAEALAELRDTFTRFVVLPSGAADALALWTLHAHAHDAATISPILTVTSPVMRCGKTTLLEVLGALVPRALEASSITGPSMFRAVEAFRPTLLCDEVDTYIAGNDGLRNVLNAGHRRRSAVVVRTVGEDHEPRIFSAWCPKVLAAIGDVPSTVTDRSIVVRLERKERGERIERLSESLLAGLEPVARRAARFADDHMDTLSEAEPTVPGALGDREADNWRPLLAVADLAGGEWPAQARSAALGLSGVADEESAGVMLLADLKELFDREGAPPVLPSAGIVAELVRLEHRPWPEWRRGNPLSARSLARLLRPFGIIPARHRDENGTQVRGYAREALTPVFGRYVPPTKGHTRHMPQNDGTNPDSQGVTGPEACDTSESAVCGATMGHVTGVTVREGGSLDFFEDEGGT